MLEVVAARGGRLDAQAAEDEQRLGRVDALRREVQQEEAEREDQGRGQGLLCQGGDEFAGRRGVDLLEEVWAPGCCVKGTWALHHDLLLLGVGGGGGDRRHEFDGGMLGGVDRLVLLLMIVFVVLVVFIDRG